MQAWLSKKDSTIMIIGRATKSAEVKKVGQYDTLKASFSLGYNKDNGENVYCNCAAFGKVADYACNVEKGNIVCAVGKVESRPYTSKDGTSKTWTEVNVKWMNILGEEHCYVSDSYEPTEPVNNASSSKSQPGAYQAAQSESYVEVADGEEDLPF